MTFNRAASLAYGDPSVGSVVLGGENNQRFPIVAWDWSTDYTGDRVSVVFRVVGRGASDNARATDLAIGVAAVAKHLAHYSGNLTLATDSETAFTGSISSIVGSPTYTATVESTTSVFTSDDVGKVIDVDTKGSFQIITYTNATTVTVRLLDGATVPTSGTGLTCRVSVPLLRYRESDRLNGYHIRPRIMRVDDPRDSRFRKTFGVEFAILGPADNTTRDPSGRQSAGFSVVENYGTRLKTVSISGVYTAVGTTSAQANYAAGIAAYAATVLSLVDSGVTFERVADEFEVDDESALCRFSQIWVEKQYGDSISTFNLDYITGAQIIFTRRNRYQFGLPGFEAPTYVQVSYSCEVDSTTYPDTTLFSVYQDTIKPYLIAQTIAKFGGTAARVIDEMPTINPERSTISAYLDVFLVRGTQPDLIHFAKTAEFNLMTQNDIRNRWDGAPHKYIVWTPGPMIVARTMVEVERVGPPTFEAEAGLLGVKAGEVVFFPPRGSGINETSSLELQVPAAPPFGALANGGKVWILLGITSSHMPAERGRDPENSNAFDFTTKSFYSTSWLWGDLVVDAPLRDDLQGSTPIEDSAKPRPPGLPEVTESFFGPPPIRSFPAPPAPIGVFDVTPAGGGLPGL